MSSTYSNPNNYIGEDALNPKYNGIVFFSDYSWYDGNVYVEGGKVTNNKKIDPIKLEDMNYYINYIINMLIFSFVIIHFYYILPFFLLFHNY